ncbi:MAG: helix-turn-helix domain-containing protein [Ruminiclostridium sp.]
MDKKEFKERLAENEYENINVLQLFGLQDDVYVGGSIEIYHKPCGHTDCVNFRQGIYENAVVDCINDYCSECRRKMNNTVEFVKDYIEWLYVDVTNDTHGRISIIKEGDYREFFKSDINLEKFAKLQYSSSPTALMKAIDEYIVNESKACETQGKRSVKIDSIKNRMTHFRNKSGISRKELAERSGIAFKTVENYELGRTKLTSVSVENAFRIAEVLGIRPEYLI